MKKLLFIMPSLGSGGAEKGLLTLLDLLDYNNYSVDLMLFRREGLFLDSVNKNVRIIDAGPDYAAFDGAFSSAVRYFAGKGDYKGVCDRIAYKLALKRKSPDKIWRLLSTKLPELPETYDAAFGYLEGNAVYYCIDKVSAKKKIGYVHNDYSKLGLPESFDCGYFKKLDYLVTVSDECAAVLNKIFPEMRDKTCVVHNITSKNTVEHLALGEVPEYAYDGIKLLTVGRLSMQKGYELAVEAARLLKEDGISFKWFAIGKGEEQAKIEALIAEYKLESEFILLGERSNPYPYIRNCDIYVQTSRFEGKSIAVDEAKCLAKPIVVTCFSTVFDQISDGKNGLIAQMEPESIKEKIKLLLGDNELKRLLGSNLRQEAIGNESEIEKIYDMAGR